MERRGVIGLNNRSSKKALSTIVATLIILLLVMVAVGIVWIVVRNVIQQGAEQVSLGKLTLDLQIQQVKILNSNTISVKVSRQTGAGEFTGLSFVVEDGDQTEVVDVNVSMAELEQRTFNLTLAGINTANLKKVSVAPVFTLESGKEAIGPVKSEYTVSSSSSTDGTTPTNNCGNGVVETGETCDDGDTTSGDGCSSSCAIESGYGCSGQPSVCTLNPVCGNSLNETGEQCDDGDTTSGDGCSSTCTIESGYTCTGGTGQSVCTAIQTAPSWQQYLVARWNFENGALGTDSVGSNNLATYGVVADTTNYKEGSSSGHFTSDKANISDSALSAGFPFKTGDTNKKITVTFWLRLDTTDGFGYCYSKSLDANGDKVIAIFNAGGKIIVDLGYGTGTQFESISHDSYLSTNKWYFVAVTYDDSTKSYRIRIWDDSAQQILGTDKTGTTTNNIYLNNGPIVLGTTPVGYHNLYGDLDKMMVFNNTLTTTQIDEVRNAA